MVAFARSCPTIDFRLTPLAGSCLAVGQRGLAIEFGFSTLAGSRPTILRGSAPIVDGLLPCQCCAVGGIFCRPCTCRFEEGGSVVSLVSGVVPLLGRSVSLAGCQVTLVPGRVSPVANLVSSGTSLVSLVASVVSLVSRHVPLVGSFISAFARFVSALAGLVSADPRLVSLLRSR